MKKEKKYSIVLFCNKKRVRVLYSCMKRTTVYEYWREYRTQVKPRFTKQQTGSRNNKDLIYELALIFPNNRWATDVWVKDSLGRNQKAKIENDKFRIKEIIPYWKEELIYDFKTKKRIRYHQVLDYILTINDIAQIFTLNKNLFVQITRIKYYIYGTNINCECILWFVHFSTVLFLNCFKCFDEILFR